MTYRVHIQPSAEADLENAYQWIARDAPLAAARWYKGLVEALDTLHVFPERCPLAPEDRAFPETIRQLLYGRRRQRYRILFTIEADRVEILHIRHGSRQHLDGEG
jgi:plasmid stabilization system protein ParE